MVEVIDVIGIIKQGPKTTKLVKELLAGNISEIKPITSPNAGNGFAYPEVENLLEVTTQEAITILEFLANEDILSKNFGGHILFCPNCQSPDLKSGFGCPNCGSGNVGKGRILEHFACRNNSLEDDYAANGKYICPQCKQELRFLGTDYQSLGINYKCRECGAISKEATSVWQCLKCSKFFPEHEAKETVLYSYHLNVEKKRKMGFELDERPRFVDFLKKQGYEVIEGANVKGTTKSGAKHLLDILARRDDGLITYTIGIGILISNLGQEVNLAEVLAFDNKMYDLGIHDKVLLVVPKLDNEANQYAKQQRIKIIEEKDLETVLNSPSPSGQRQPSSKPFTFETKAKLLDHLKSSGYRFEEKAKILGRSGVEHIFDILALNDDGIITHTLGINILVAKDEISFNEVSLFDTRAYDASIHDKLLLACPRLSNEARQLAQYQRIKVIEVDDPGRLA